MSLKLTFNHEAIYFLLGGVQQVCYWPNLELEKKDDMANITRVTQLFVEAEVIIDMYIPLLNLEKVRKKISPKTAVMPTHIKTKCNSFFDLTNILDILEALGSSHMKEKDFKAKFMCEIENAHTCYCELLNSSDGSFEHQRSAEGHNDNVNGRQPNVALENDNKDIHALQLCFLLAARTGKEQFACPPFWLMELCESTDIQVLVLKVLATPEKLTARCKRRHLACWKFQRTKNTGITIKKQRVNLTGDLIEVSKTKWE